MGKTAEAKVRHMPERGAGRARRRRRAARSARAARGARAPASRTRLDALARGEARHEGEDRRLRRRRRLARQVRLAREAPLGGEGRPRLLRRRVRLGPRRRAVRQREGDRLAHRLPGRAARVVDLSTARVIPWEPDTAAFLLDFVNADGSPFEPSPRQLLQRVGRQRARARASCRAFGSEYEYFIFQETPQSLREKGFRDLDAALARACSATRGCAAPRTPALVHAIIDGLQRLRHPGRGDAHRDRARASTRPRSATTTSSAPPTRRRSSRRR